MIDDVNDPIVKRLKKLSTKAGRISEGLFLVEGKIQIEHLKQSNFKVNKYYSVDGSIGEQISLKVASELSEVYDPQSYFAEVQLPEYHKIPVSGKWLILDGIQDPGNVGSLLRTANAFDFNGVVMNSRSADLYSAKVLRAAKGANFLMPILTNVNIAEFIQEHKSNNFKIYGTLVDDKADGLGKIKPSENFALIIGNEGVGMSGEIAELTDQNIFIEINQSKQDSLNAALAGAIIMYQLSKNA